MEVWYYIVEAGKEKRVTYEAYKQYEGKKYYTAPALNRAASFIHNLLKSY